MPVSVSFQAFRPASWLITIDTDSIRNPARFIPTDVTSKNDTISTTEFRKGAAQDLNLFLNDFSQDAYSILQRN